MKKIPLGRKPSGRQQPEQYYFSYYHSEISTKEKWDGELLTPLAEHFNSPKTNRVL
jgi:hypothetical protein